MDDTQISNRTHQKFAFEARCAGVMGLPLSGCHIAGTLEGNLYIHHGIYISDDEVIDKQLDGFRHCTFEEFQEYSPEWHVVRFPVSEEHAELITKRARQAFILGVDEEASCSAGQYNLVSNNCERFAIYCFTGDKQGRLGDQVECAVAAGIVGGVGAAAISTSAALGAAEVAAGVAVAETAVVIGEAAALGAGGAAMVVGEAAAIEAVAVGAGGAAVAEGAAIGGMAVAGATAGVAAGVGLVMGGLIYCHWKDATDLPFAVVNRSEEVFSVRVHGVDDEDGSVSVPCTKFIADVPPGELVKFNPLNDEMKYQIKLFEKDWHPFTQFSKELARMIIGRGDIALWDGSSLQWASQPHETDAWKQSFRSGMTPSTMKHEETEGTPRATDPEELRYAASKAMNQEEWWQNYLHYEEGIDCTTPSDINEEEKGRISWWPWSTRQEETCTIPSDTDQEEKGGMSWCPWSISQEEARGTIPCAANEHEKCVAKHEETATNQQEISNTSWWPWNSQESHNQGEQEKCVAKQEETATTQEEISNANWWPWSSQESQQR